MNLREKTIKNNFKFFGSISICYGILFAFCMYRNLFGATFLLYTAVTVGVLVLFLNKVEIKVKQITMLYFFLILLCGISTCITSNKLLQWINWCCILGLLIMAMLRQFFDESRWNIEAYMMNATVLLFTTVCCSFLPLAETKKFAFRNSESKETNKSGYYIIIGILGAIGILFLILPLLISSDLIFRQLFGQFIGLFKLEKIGPNLWTACGIMITAFIGFVLIYSFFYASCHVNFSKEKMRVFAKCNAMMGISFASVVGGIYLLYSGIQIVYLFFGREGKLPVGITYSEYARSGFWQLVAVAMLNIIIVLVCMYLFEENKYLKWLLTVICGCTFIMTASAAYRMYLYVKAYHLTFLRLLVFWALLVLTIIMCGVVVSIYRNNFRLVHFLVMVSVCGYLIFSFARPDYIIAKYNVSHMDQMRVSDLNYMLYGLSLDATPVIADIEAEDLYTGAYHENLTEAKGQMYSYFRSVSENNEGIYFRRANYSRIQAKRAADAYLAEHETDKELSEMYKSIY